MHRDALDPDYLLPAAAMLLERLDLSGERASKLVDRVQGSYRRAAALL